MIALVVLVVAVLIIAIWVLIEVKRMKHKLFGLFLIGLIIFLSMSSVMVFRGKDIDFKTMSGLVEAGQVYFSWLGSLFVNAKSITSYAIKMDWKGDPKPTSNLSSHFEPFS
ncbi:MAG: hypothetical protein ABIA78_02130 [archaeon]